MRLKPYQWAALVIAFIVALADMVIIYDLWLAGSWLSNPLLAGSKTAAFVLIFVGSLIAEMQELKPSARWLLLGCVALIGGYQAIVNMVVNFHGAAIPATAVAFFEPLNLTELQVKFGYAITDAVVRCTAVVIMWLVTGLVWRGAATVIKGEKESAPQKKRAITSKTTNGTINGSVGLEEATPTILQTIEKSDDGKINQTALAKELAVSRQTMANWMKHLQDEGAILTLPGRGRFQVREMSVEMEMPTFDG